MILTNSGALLTHISQILEKRPGSMIVSEQLVLVYPFSDFKVVLSAAGSSCRICQIHGYNENKRTPGIGSRSSCLDICTFMMNSVVAGLVYQVLKSTIEGDNSPNSGELAERCQVSDETVTSPASHR